MFYGVSEELHSVVGALHHNFLKFHRKETLRERIPLVTLILSPSPLGLSLSGYRLGGIPLVLWRHFH